MTSRPSRSKVLVELALKQFVDESLSDLDQTSGSEYLPSSDVTRTSVSSMEPTPNLDHKEISVKENYSLTELEPTTDFNISNLENYQNISDSSVLFNDSVNSTEDQKLNNLQGKHINRRRRRHNCIYCNLDVGNFARHLERNHSDEFKVQEILSLKKQSSERKKKIEKLRREGDFLTSKVVPVVTRHNQQDLENYLPCKFCTGYFAKNHLRKHTKKCYFNPNPKARLNSQIEGQNLMAGHFGPKDPLRVSGLIKMLRADKITIVAKKDQIICEVARRYIKSHKEKHLITVAKRKMRRLSRLLISVREKLKNNSLTMLDILKPSNFQILITSTKEITGYNDISKEFKSPSMALQMGTLLKHAINAASSLQLQKEKYNKELVDSLSRLTSLIEADWAQEISSEASQNLNLNRFNKPSLIPAAEDIKKFQVYLKNLITKSRCGLIEDPNSLKHYRNLLDGLFCTLLIFNKRRVGELQRMTLSSYLKNYDKTPSSEFQKILTDTEKILCQSLKRVVIRGKRGRGVPVLFDRKTEEAFNDLIKFRENFDLANNIYLFGLPSTNNPITGYVVMRKHVKIAFGNFNKTTLLTSTKLRKHLGTIAQIFNMEKNDLEQLATFMGHEKSTHMNWYRLPDDVYQTAKVSKLLMLSNRGELDKYKGKSLNEINIDEFLEEENETEIGDQTYESNHEDINESDEPGELTGEPNEDEEPNDPPKKKKKRTLVPWTTEQKKLTESHFANHIKKKIPPKKAEVLKFISQNPRELRNKSWQVIKAYVYNQYSKK